MKAKPVSRRDFLSHAALGGTTSLYQALACKRIQTMAGNRGLVVIIMGHA
jgi:hypothetical protein